MMNKINSGFVLKSIAFALAATAVVLGFLIYRAKFYHPSQAAKAPAVQKVEVKGGVPNAMAVLASSASTPQEKQAYLDLIRKDAVKTSKIGVASCKPTPLAASVVEDSMIDFVNTGTGNVTVVFDVDKKLDLAPGETKSMKAHFPHGPAIYGYGCSNVPNAVGYIVVVK